MSELWSKGLAALQPYVPGEQPNIEKLTKLNTNENPYGPGPTVANILAEFDADRLRLYPDPSSQLLRETVARYHSVSAEQVFVGNGSDEVLAHVFRGFFKRDLPIFFPDITYSFYPVYCKLFDIPCETIALQDDFSIALKKYAVDNSGVIFANPNAPTGKLMALADIESFLKINTRSVVVVDEAYIDFAADGSSAIALVSKFPNLLVVRTLSKSRALAGLRLGYAIGSEHLIEGLNRVKDSFNSYPVDQLASAVAIASFSDQAYFEKIVADVIEQREWLVTELTEIGYSCLPSAANFLMCQPPRAAAEVAQLLREQGIIVRYFDKPRLSDYLRITVGNESQNKLLIKALKNI